MAARMCMLACKHAAAQEHDFWVNVLAQQCMRGLDATGRALNQRCWVACGAGALAPDAEEGEAAGAPGIGPDTTLDSLQPLWGADPRWQVRADTTAGPLQAVCSSDRQHVGCKRASAIWGTPGSVQCILRSVLCSPLWAHLTAAGSAGGAGVRGQS
jgi:hypothetical protein